MVNLEVIMMALVKCYLRPFFKFDSNKYKPRLSAEIRFEEVESDYVANLGLETLCIETDSKIFQPLCVINESYKWLISDLKFYEILKSLVDSEISKGDKTLKSNYLLDIDLEELDLGGNVNFMKGLKKISKVVGPDKTKTLIEWVDNGKSQNKN